MSSIQIISAIQHDSSVVIRLRCSQNVTVRAYINPPDSHANAGDLYDSYRTIRSPKIEQSLSAGEHELTISTNGTSPPYVLKVISSDGKLKELPVSDEGIIVEGDVCLSFVH